MCRCGKWCSLDGRAFLHSIVPQHNLSGICSAQNQVGMETGECGGQHSALTMEYVLGRRLLKLSVPHQDDAIWIVGRFFVVVVGSEQQLRKLWRPIQWRNNAVLGPSLVEECTIKRQSLMRLFVSTKRLRCILKTVNIIFFLQSIFSRSTAVVGVNINSLANGTFHKSSRPVHEMLEVLRQDNHLLLLLAQFFD